MLLMFTENAVTVKDSSEDFTSLALGISKTSDLFLAVNTAHVSTN